MPISRLSGNRNDHGNLRTPQYLNIGTTDALALATRSASSCVALHAEVETAGHLLGAAELWYQHPTSRPTFLRDSQCLAVLSVDHVLSAGAWIE